MVDYIGLCMLILLLATVSEVTGGKVSIDLNLLSMIKVQKDLDLCNVLTSDIIQGDLSCPLPAGDLVLEALGTDDDPTTTQCVLIMFTKIAFIPKEIPRLPLDGRIRISDQLDRTVTCIHLNFNLK